MTAEIKICGLTRPEDVEAAIFYGADYLGFIIEAKSKRRLNVRQAAHLSIAAKGIIPRVAVTVNADTSLIKEIVTCMQPDIIQFHGDEAPSHVASVGRDFAVKTIKAIPVRSPGDVIAALDFSGFADYLLFDSKPPKGEKIRGGHGLPFDWSILEETSLPNTWFLAGGLSPENVLKAQVQTKAPILDVSSGVEIKPGIKDAAKVRNLCEAIKRG